MLTNFERSLQWVLQDEGGNDDDPNDHGGRTSRGIIQREYDAYRTRLKLYKGDVWKASDTEIRAIYHDQYWEPWCDKLPSGVDYVFFDASVNAGPVQAVKHLQKALGSVKVDGHFGMATLTAVQAVDPGLLVKKFCEVRRNFYRHLAQFPRYGRGWLSRVDHAENGAARLIKSDSAPRPVMEPAIQALATIKADASDVETPMVPPEAGIIATAATSVTSGLTDQLQSTFTSLQPLADTINEIKYVLIAISILSLAITLYSVWRRYKIKKETA